MGFTMLYLYNMNTVRKVIKMEKINVVKAGLLGLGTVGSGVYKMIQRQMDEMEFKTGARLEIAKILVHNKNKKREGVDEALLTDQWQDIIQDDEIQIVIEVMGGIEPAKTMILEALNSGKNVVTANKDLVAEYGRELLDAAENNGVDFLFEAAVAGGIPIIRPMKQCLAVNEIDEVIGIVNGTTNYILTKMVEEGWDFDEALAKATELGYAEADPTADIEGLDAGRKMAIMASIAFHSRVTFSDVYTEGITRISSTDINYAKGLGRVIKLLGVAHNTENGIEVAVHPMMIKEDHPLATVRDAFNAVFIHGDAVDDVMFYGRGAGEFPTASAVMGDVIDVIRDIQFHCTARINCTCYRKTKVKNMEDVMNRFFIRIQGDNKPGVLAAITSVFGEHEVSITNVVQKVLTESVGELIIVTEAVKEYQIQNALEDLKNMKSTREICNVIRVY